MANSSDIQARLEAHKAVLQAAGVQSLSALGILNISGPIVPQRGLTTPQIATSSGTQGVVTAARVFNSGIGQFVNINNAAATLMRAAELNDSEQIRARGDDVVIPRQLRD